MIIIGIISFLFGLSCIFLKETFGEELKSKIFEEDIEEKD
jgi:hypothetical protein